MRIIYTPKGENPRIFDLNDIDADLEGPEYELIEGAGGEQWDTFGGWFDQLSREGYRAAKALIWVLLRRENPSLGFEELARFKPSDVVIAASVDEVDEGKDESGPDDSVTGDAPTSSESPTPDSAP